METLDFTGILGEKGPFNDAEVRKETFEMSVKFETPDEQGNPSPLCDLSANSSIKFKSSMKVVTNLNVILN